MTDAAPRSRGHLNPGAPDVSFDRFALGPGVDELVRHVWVVRWRVPSGDERTQRVLSYPAVNVVFEPSGTGLWGPNSRVDERRLTGASWAVGVLCRPAAALLLGDVPPRELVARGAAGIPLPDSPLTAVALAMDEAPDAARARLVAVLRSWLAPLADRVDSSGVTLNAVCRLAEEDESLTRAAELAERVGMTQRSLERLVGERLGVTPKWLIECRRLQNAATQLFADGATDLSVLAAELGYADYAHFSRRYKTVLAETPEQTRRAGRAARDDDA